MESCIRNHYGSIDKKDTSRTIYDQEISICEDDLETLFVSDLMRQCVIINRVNIMSFVEQFLKLFKIATFIKHSYHLYCFKVSSLKKIELLHLQSLKDEANFLQNEKEKIEREIEKIDNWLDDIAISGHYRNDHYFPNAINPVSSGASMWPSGSNPSYRTDDRREEENNDGWIR